MQDLLSAINRRIIENWTWFSTIQYACLLMKQLTVNIWTNHIPYRYLIYVIFCLRNKMKTTDLSGYYRFQEEYHGHFSRHILYVEVIWFLHWAGNKKRTLHLREIMGHASNPSGLCDMCTPVILGWKFGPEVELSQCGTAQKLREVGNSWRGGWSLGSQLMRLIPETNC